MAGQQRQNLRGIIMIELTEIVSEPSSYNPETKTVDTLYKLGTLYVNPRFIVEFRKNEELTQKHASSGLIEGLSENAGFIKVVVSSGGNWHKTYNVVGHPEQLLDMLRG